MDVVRRCGLAAHAFLSVPVEAIAGLRKRPGPIVGEPLPATFLRHTDEQTVVGLAAVYQAIDDQHLARAGEPLPFADWAVLAAPRFIGRAAMAQALSRFIQEGAWGVSPHLIPHRSLHSMSGAISLALRAHGPNFGVGGGPGCEGEAVLAGLALLEGMGLPGVWLVLTRVEPEGPADTGQPAAGSSCQALALALVPADSPLAVGWLDLTPGSPASLVELAEGAARWRRAPRLTRR